MTSPESSPENAPNLSGLGRALLDTGGSKPSSGPWMPPTAEELHAILPQYEIVKMLGRGGMGAVYMGRQTALDRPVAIKILSAQLEESDMGFSERFKNEARAMGKLNHPSIVSVYEFGQHESGLLYIVMEYVDGTDVAKMIAKSGRLHTEHAMAITAHVCDALAYAHERGIIHRDIKPANVMVDYDGSVKIADFGLAKVSTSNGSTLGLTQSGMAMGTLHFMAPEALMLGTAVDHRADIYAVGVMLYQMLTGKLPQGMFKMPSLQVPGLDPRYDGIIAKAMMEDREARYQSARSMRSDLDGILTQPVVRADPEAAKAQQPVLPTQARPQRPGGKPVMRQSVAPGVPQSSARSSQSWLWMSALGLLALCGAAWWMIQPRGQTGQPAAAEGADSTKPAYEAQTIATSVTTTNPAEATKGRPFVNSLGMKFVPVPGTNTLFCIHETRYKDYAAFASEIPGLKKDWKDQSADGFTPSGNLEEHPVMKVSWEDARRFCEWLAKKNDQNYRLPTDREWSIAAGVGQEETWLNRTTPATVQKNSSQFVWGSQWPPPQNSGNFSDTSRKSKIAGSDSAIAAYDDGFPSTAPVMQFAANPFGIYDLGGNVWEWCEDGFDQSLSSHVLRGGSYFDGEKDTLLASHRSARPPEHGSRYIGFRVALTLEPLVASAPPIATQPTDTQEPQSEWSSLFNGKDLTGWRVIGNSSGFSIDQGSIKTGGIRADLIYTGSGASPKVFRDFELRMKVKTGSKGNSGLWFHLPPGIQSTKEADQSLQVQIDNSFHEQRTGSIVHIEPLGRSAVADDVWFELGVLVQNGTVTAFVDGKQVNQWTQPQNNWQPPAIAALARMGTGAIGLESWKGSVWFKDIQLRVLEAPDEKLILGRWVRTNMDRPGDAYLMDLSADGSALWTGDNTNVRGTWQIKRGLLEVDWNSLFKFRITPPSTASSTILKGTANWPDGKSTEIVYERQPAGADETATLVENFNGHRYQFVPGALTWKEAKVNAESMGGHLVTITSKEENEWLLLTFRKLLMTPNRNIWLGASEEMAGLGWKWVTGEPFTPLGWFPGEPNGKQGGGGQVGHPFMLNLYSFKDGAVGWNDSSTHFSQSQSNIGFIVEWDSASSETTTPVPIGSAPTWTDTKGRSLQALFARIEAANALLVIAGKLTPVALETLSPASQELARTMQSQAAAQAGGQSRNDRAILQRQLSDAGATDFFATSRFLYAVFPKTGPQGPDPKTAPQIAKMLGGRLPIFHSHDEFLEIRAFAVSIGRKRQTDYLTLGMNRGQDGSVRWDDGVKVSDSIAWGNDASRGFFRIQLDRIADTKFGYQAFDPASHAKPVLMVQYELAEQSPSSQALPSAPATISKPSWLEGRWLQSEIHSPGANYIVDYLPGQIVIFKGGNVDGLGQWTLNGTMISNQWHRGNYDTTAFSLAPGGRAMTATLTLRNQAPKQVRYTKLADAVPVPLNSEKELEGKLFDFGWISKTDASSSRLNLSHLLLQAKGRFDVIKNTNESSWEVRNGKLLFKDASGSVTTTFDRCYKLDGRWLFVGDFQGNSGIRHILREQFEIIAPNGVADTGWTPLFPGDSLSGWTGGDTSYRIANGILTGTGRGDLISPKEYGGFHLKFDLRISGEANSGIGIWREASTSATASAPHGFEVQIQDDTAPKYRSQEFWQRHGGIYYFKEPLALAMNPVGSWNTHEIIVEGTQIKVTINGKLVQDADVTKLRPVTARAPVLDVSRKRGHLIILGRNGVAEFRNMQIKELP